MASSEGPNVYSEDRPLFAGAKQTPMFQEMHDYAHKVEVQALLQRMCADLFCERPEKPLDYMRKWLDVEAERSKNK